MIAWRLSDEPIAPDEDEELHSPEVRAKIGCTIFLGLTSNLISAGTRETVRYLVQHKKVHCIVTTAGGIEEDIMKCLAPHYMGDSTPAESSRQKLLRRRGGDEGVPRQRCSPRDSLLRREARRAEGWRATTTAALLSCVAQLRRSAVSLSCVAQLRGSPCGEESCYKLRQSTRSLVQAHGALSTHPPQRALRSRTQATLR